MGASAKADLKRSALHWIVAALLLAPSIAFAQAQSPTTVNVNGGSQGAAQTVPTGEARFGMTVPLKPNAENTLTVLATDADGRTARVDDLKVAQITLTDIVKATVTAQRLTTTEVRQLVAEGVIDITDPDNYNVSRFVVALVVGGQQVQVSVPVVRQLNQPIGEGETITIGCASPGQPLTTTGSAIAVPCGDGGSTTTVKDVEIVPFEVVTPVPGLPDVSVPGVIVIEGRVKTLKEFFKVNLLLMNVSSLFTLTDVTARIEVPQGALTPVVPDGGSIALADVAAGTDTTGQFIVRGDEKGIHTVTVHFGGNLVAPFLTQPVAFSGKASTDLEVKGPPTLDVKVTHPDYVTENVPYDLVITIKNTDEVLDALYTSLAIDVGGNANLIDPLTGNEIDGPVTRTVGDILRGETVVQSYRVMPKVTGPITSCVGAADANIQLSVQFIGRDVGCAIGTLPAERLTSDGKPTVTVVPAHNTVDVPFDPAIVALFSDKMIEATITTGYPSASFNVLDPDGHAVDGTLSFSELFGGTAAIFRPTAPLAFATTYTIVVNPSIFNLDGLSLASGIAARFTTQAAPSVPDGVAPTVSLTLAPPLVATAIARGQSAEVVVDSSDAVGVTRIELLLDDRLIDTQRPQATVRFLVETGALEAASSHQLRARAFDAAGNTGVATLDIAIAPDVNPPTATISNPASIVRGSLLPVSVDATDDGRVAKVELFVDDSQTTVGSGLVAPFRFTVATAALSVGAHLLRAVVADGAGNIREAAGSFSVALATSAPRLTLVSPLASRFKLGSPISFLATASDDYGIASVIYALDGASNPIGSGMGGITLPTLGLALGPHVVTVTAVNTSGLSAVLPIQFEMVETLSTTAPAPVNGSLVTLGAITNGIVGVSGAPGAVAGALGVSITNLVTQASALVRAAADGSFLATVEASGGHTLSIVVIDADGNRSTPLALLVPIPPTLASMSVAPTSVSLDRLHTSATLAVTGLFSDGTQRPLAGSEIAFASSAPTIATVTAAGVVLPGQNGSATITVSAIGSAIAPVSVPVTVNLATTTGLSVTPNPMTIAGVGHAARMTVKAQFADGTTGSFNGSVKFTTGNPAIAVVDGTGLVTSTGIGSTSIYVASSGLPTTSVLVVVQPVQPTDLVVSPNTVSFSAVGQSTNLVATLHYSDGTTASADGVTYTSLDPSVVSVSSSGVVTAVAEGTTSIVARALTLTASVPVSVTLPATAPPPVLSSLGRPIAGDGDTLELRGANFSATPAGNFVTIGGLHADVTGAATDRLIVTVPRGASTGQVEVRVAGQNSNTLDLSVYARRAQAVLASAPFNASPAAAGQTADLGSATFYLYPGDQVVLAADANTINSSTWTALLGPTFTGTFILTVNGVERVITASSSPVDITTLLPTVTEPTAVTVAARIEPLGGGLAAGALAIVAGPPSTGAFAGERFLPGDTIARQTTLRFRVAAPDGTKFAATATNWFRVSDGGCCNGSAGGAIVGGASTPNDSSFRTFTASGGEVAVTYSSTGVLADFASPKTAVVALVAADASGNRIASTPVAEGRILLGALDSASVVPQQTTTVADGVDRPITVTIDSLRDNYGNRIVDGTHVALTASSWIRRSDGACCNGSAGGRIAGGSSTPNDGAFRTAVIVNGSTQLTYSSDTITLSGGATANAILAATVANASNSRVTTRPFAEGRVGLSSVTAASATVTELPNTLTASTADSRSVITLSGLTDSVGQPVPDGTRIAVTAASWYRQSDGACCNGSFGGTIVGGDPVPNDGGFRSFVVQGGQVTFTYSNVGLALDRGATATTVIAILPAKATGDRIGTTPLVEARITQAGVTTATITATPASTLADGVRRPVAVAVTNIRDAAGHVVPDGTRIALTAASWYRRDDGACCNGSAGGILLDGVSAPNDAAFRVFTVSNGRVDATFSAETISPFEVTTVKSSVIAATVANASNNNRVTTIPFGEGTIAVSSVAAATATASPVTLLADKQARTSTVTVSGLTDAQGLPVPDGTKVAITANDWYRLSDGGCCNGSAGGTMLGGDPTPNDGSFRTYTVVNGEVTATYSDAGRFVDTGNTAPAILSILPANAQGSRVGNRPFAVATVTLAGYNTGTFAAPATTTAGGTVSMTLSNIRDAAGNLVPDGAKVAVTANNWSNRDGSCCNGSAGGTIVGGAATPNDGSFRTFVVSGGAITFSFTAPATANTTSVISAVSADGAGSRNSVSPFATFAIRTQ